MRSLLTPRPKELPFLRDVNAGKYFEAFLVAAITTALLIRSSLYLSGYPSIRFGSLHISHVLLGGVLLTIALLILLGNLGQNQKKLAAAMGGIGFGMFVDELGKFITSDNNYFYKPVPALMYTIFVLLFLWSRSVESRQRFTQKEYLANVLEELQEAIAYDLDPKEKARAMELLDQCDPHDPLVKQFRELFGQLELVAVPKPGIVTQMKRFLHNLYHFLVEQPWFPKAVITLFATQSIISFFVAILRVQGTLSRETSFAGWGELFSSAAAGAIVLAGILRIRVSRMAAFRMFHRAILVSIFLTEFFLFLQSQFLAIVGLAANLVILATINYMMMQERILQREHL